MYALEDSLGVHVHYCFEIRRFKVCTRTNMTKRLVHSDDIVLIFFHIMSLQEYLVLMESRIPLKPVLGSVRIVALSIGSHEQTQ